MRYLKFIKASVFSVIFLLSILSCSAESAQQEEMVDATAVIQNLSQVIHDAKQKVQIPVIFPTIIPKKSAPQFFANLDSSSKERGLVYRINVDGDKTCNGAHYCNVGYVTAKQGIKPEKYLDRNDQPITETVVLANKITGYYTPGHPMGSFFPANIQWNDKDVLYTIAWNTSSKDSLIKMANSAIKEAR